MSDEQMLTAIGRAISVSDSSRRKLHALASELNHSAESFDLASKALRDLVGVSSVRSYDITSVLSKIPDLSALSEQVKEYQAERIRSAELAERARELRGV